MEEVKRQLESNNVPINIYNDMVIKGECPRNKRQIYNKKQAISDNKGKNIADQLQQVMTESTSSKFLRSYVAADGNPPDTSIS